MARFDYRTLPSVERKALIGELLEVIEVVKEKEDLQTFFLQLVTPSEAIMLARRWQIAKQLAAGQSYYRIAADLKVGMSTVASVDRWLSEAIGDYRHKLEQAQAQAARQRRKARQSKTRLFPNTLPFLLLNLIVSGATRIWWTELAAENKKLKSL